MEEEKTIWCGNLSDKVSEELLYELFLQAAPLQRVHIPQDKEGRKSNFAFVSFKHDVSVKYASQLLNGICLYDKPLNIKPRCRNQDSENLSNSRDKNEETHRRFHSQRHNESAVHKSEPYFENLMQMGQMVNASTMQPTYSSSVDRRANNFMGPRNYRRDDRKPYSRNNHRHNRNHNRSYERQRYY